MAAELHGEPVIDLWGGTVDYERQRPWDKDTLCVIFSTSKIAMFMTWLLLYDRGQLDLDRPIAEYWPEFGQNGKEHVTARQVFTHTAGLPGFGQPIGFDELHDWDHMIGVIERARPWFEPGTASHYSFLAVGFIVGGLVERIAGTPFRDFFRTELAEPLHADYRFGISGADDLDRLAVLWPPDDMGEYLSDPAFAEIEGGVDLGPDRLGALLPSMMGITNARGVARIGSVIAANGSVDGRHYLRPETVAEAGREQSFKDDPFIGPVRLGLGFGIHHDGFPTPTPSTMHWGGFGGSLATMDPATGLSFAYVPNKLSLEDGPVGEIRGTHLYLELSKVSNELESDSRA